MLWSGSLTYAGMADLWGLSQMFVFSLRSSRFFFAQVIVNLAASGQLETFESGSGNPCMERRI